ncbi:chromobox protein 1-like protein, partial [Leptotrombidium deliense]
MDDHCFSSAETSDLPISCRLSLVPYSGSSSDSDDPSTDSVSRPLKTIPAGFIDEEATFSGDVGDQMDCSDSSGSSFINVVDFLDLSLDVGHSRLSPGINAPQPFTEAQKCGTICELVQYNQEDIMVDDDGISSDEGVLLIDETAGSDAEATKDIVDAADICSDKDEDVNELLDADGKDSDVVEVGTKLVDVKAIAGQNGNHDHDDDNSDFDDFVMSLAVECSDSDCEPESGQFEVSSITGRRFADGGLQYFVNWKGYPRSESCWEPAENCSNSHAVITAFETAIRVDYPPND